MTLSKFLLLKVTGTSIACYPKEKFISFSGVWFDFPSVCLQLSGKILLILEWKESQGKSLSNDEQDKQMVRVS